MRYLGKDFSYVYLKCGNCKEIGRYSRNEFDKERPNKCKLCDKTFYVIWGASPCLKSFKGGVPYVVMTLFAIGAYEIIKMPYFQNIYYFNKLMTSLNSQLIAILIPVLCSILPLVFESLFFHEQERRNKALICLLLVIVAESVILGFAIATTIGSQYMTLQITEPTTGENLEYFGGVVGDVAVGKGRLFDSQGNLVYRGSFKDNLYDGYGEKYEQINSVFDEKISDIYCVVYKGFYKNGIPHGKGKEYRYDMNYTFGKSGENPYLYYDGEFSEGLYCGRGTLYGNSEKYDGTFYGGQYNGYGILWTVSSIDNRVYKYVGMFVNNVLNGEGKRYSPEGTLLFSGTYENGHGVYRISYYRNGNIGYEGGWKDNECHGYGISYWPNGNIHYDGDWMNGKYDGNGKLYYESGAVRYSGGFVADSYSNYGIYYWENGNIYYNGEFMDGEKNGYGISFRENGTLEYDGQWADDMYQGSGILYFEDGKTIQYKGGYINNHQSGSGTEYYRNGQRLYTGEWNQGYKQGNGTSYWMNGKTRYKGQWYENEYSGKGKEYDENGNLIREGVFINGELDSP